MAPELLSPGTQTSSDHNCESLVDVYSLGVTLYYFCFHRYPYVHSISRYSSISQFITDILSLPLAIPSKCPYSQKLISLIQSMLEK